jgi:hypothetical protein
MIRAPHNRLQPNKLPHTTNYEINEMRGTEQERMPSGVFRLFLQKCFKTPSGCFANCNFCKLTAIMTTQTTTIEPTQVSLNGKHNEDLQPITIGSLTCKPLSPLFGAE